jgi:RNA polymerase subunit RPABC4/transcription elongation factor Spt4
MSECKGCGRLLETGEEEFCPSCREEKRKKGGLWGTVVVASTTVAALIALGLSKVLGGRGGREA